MSAIKKNPLTFFASILVLAIVIFAQFTEKKWETPDGVFAADVKGYYGFLPAAFINHDIQLIDDAPYHAPEGTRIWYLVDEDGNRYIKYTCGLAILYSPFFAIAHSLAEPMGYAADGYSLPYRFALAMSALFYLLLGLIFMARLLLRYFSDRAVATTVLIVFLGSNALHYYTGNMTYSHGYSLAMIAVFLYYSVRWLETPRMLHAIWIGLSAGIVVLIRPVDILFLFALPLIGVFSWATLRARFLLFARKWTHVATMLLAAFLVLLPQFLYNYTVFGSMLHYSYTNESFYFAHPHILDSMFSYRNGWLVYSPMMLLSIAGLFVLGKYRAYFAGFLVPILILYIYVISSWWCWWYVGFGNRAFINLYPLLAISIAAFMERMYAQGWFQRTFVNFLVLFGLIFSVFQTYQYERWTIHWGAMTEAAYWNAFGRTEPSQIFDTLVRYPVDDMQLAGLDAVYEPTQRTVYKKYYSFESKQSCDSALWQLLDFSGAHHGKGALKIAEGQEFPGLKMPVNIKGIDAIYVRAWIKDLPKDVHLTLSRVEPVSYYRSSYEAWREDGPWTEIHLFAWIPESLALDSLDFAIWNQGKHAFILDDLSFQGIKFKYTKKVR